MSRPVRIQRKRTKGWKMPPNTVYVGRGSPWGNPFRITEHFTAADAVRDFRKFVDGQLTNGTGYALAPLRGKNLACWCPLNQPCHADVLIELANPKDTGA